MVRKRKKASKSYVVIKPEEIVRMNKALDWAKTHNVSSKYSFDKYRECTKLFSKSINYVENKYQPNKDLCSSH